ncbi:YihY/virulence factor BrkB family protein [Kitasatospora sp. GP82]|uniref:YihY/virulence factor BrkB family protein n=1 Tax=Kitasatospora sp. GP82 TaxID=3035089 RepID=UPI00247345C0|nr:YihY/virulence factor BrkB family protein [Kitasatospora sp. GP82]MDH6130471.1 membrane protein [Kitasatospora sp. GP82]
MAPHDNDHDSPTAPGPHAGPLAHSPTDLPKRSWRDVLKRTATEFRADNLGDSAAALTYYSVLSIFPVLLATVSILGLLGRSTITPLIDHVRSLAPGSARQLITSVLDQLQHSQAKAGIAFVVGIVVAVWSASNYAGAFMRVSNTVYDIGEGKPIWKTLPARLAIAVALIVLLTLAAVAAVFTGPLASKTGQILGLGNTAITVWSIAKWPVMIVAVSLLIALLYWAVPNVKQPGFRWATPGGVLAVIVWFIASVLFALYIATFSSFDKTYGSFAAIIAFLIWLWISNMAILLGLEFNAELGRQRAIETGHPAAEEPYIEPRDTHEL